MLTIVDFNNFWSPSGGGVRRYHLQKMEFYKTSLQVQSANARLVFVMPDGRTYTEKVTDNLIIEHVEAFRFPGKWEYRFMWKRKQIAPILEKYMPDAIEVGSPYILCSRVKKYAKKICPNAKLFGFWHADFPVTYVERPFTKKFGTLIGKIARQIAFAYARFEYSKYDGIEVSSEEIRKRLVKNKLPAWHWIPLGCDIEQFAPTKRDEALVEQLRDGDATRPIIFFPHRFCAEKGVDLLLPAYKILVEKLGKEPALVLAGTGPMLPDVEAAVAENAHMQYIGFVNSIDEMARYYASADMGLALSGWETFGLSILESMACGNGLVAASTGAAAEHVRNSGAGLILEERTPEALADAIVQLLEHKEFYAKNARSYAEKYSWDACFERQLELYKQTTDVR